MTNLAELAHVAVGALIAALGLALMAAGALGLLRFPDVYTRAHALLSPLALGALATMAGLAVVAWDAALSTRLLLLGVLMAIALPHCAQLIANAAHVGGLSPLTGAYVAPRPQAARTRATPS